MAKYSTLAVIIDLTSQSPSTAPRDQFRNFHHAAERVVPHHEQTASSLPINRLQRGQRIARCAIRIPRKFRRYASEVSRAATPTPSVIILHYRYRILPQK
jgi:hypothetical protein